MSEILKSEFEDEITAAMFPPKSRRPDRDQMRAITKSDNAVVSAGAGSGKTETLASRYVYLLLKNPDLRVKNILAITFTKKAAAEIYERVFIKLNHFCDVMLASGKTSEAEILQRAINEFSDAKIQTLDSLSSDIVRLAAAQYGVRPDFSIGESAQNADALYFTLQKKDEKNSDGNLKYEEAFKAFCKVGKIEDFAKAYFSDAIEKYTSIATEKNFFQNNFNLQIKKIITVWNNSVSEKIGGEYSCQAKWKNFKTCFAILNEQEKPAAIVEKIKETGIEKQNPPFVEIKSEDEIRDSEKRKSLVNSMQALFDALEKLSSVALRGSAKNNDFLNLKTSMTALRQPSDTKEISVFETIKSALAFVKNYEAQEQMFKMMDEFLLETRREKLISGKLSFKDVSDLALRILKENKEVRAQQKSQIKKIMIDEFQDNNSQNRDLLYLIAERDDDFTEYRGNANEFFAELEKNISLEKLFFVGDEKQSIYKFRGADVSVFNKLQQSLRGVSGNASDACLKMANNYRSDTELVKSFNLLFGDDGKRQADENAKSQPSVFYFEHYPVKDFEAKYQKADFAKKMNSDGNDTTENIVLSEKNIRIHACVLNSGKNAGEDESEKSFAEFKKKNECLNEDDTCAFFIARTVYDLHKNHGKKFSDFAILDSSRTHRSNIKFFLEKFAIPYNLDEQKNIFEDGIANDIYNFLRICVYPNDTNSFAAFLASPFVGMSMTGVENTMAVLLDKTSNFQAFAPDTKTKALRDALSASDMEKYKRAGEIYFAERKFILSSSVTKTLERLWYKDGYFFETLRDENLKVYAEQFDLLYQIALQAENADKNIAWFVDQLSLIKQGEALFAGSDDSELDTKSVHYPLEKKDCVSVMTIHQSKGLEFGTVFVTGIFGKPKSDFLRETFFDEESGVSLKCDDTNYFFAEKREENAEKDLAEMRRKIYVAITRAKNEAYLVGDLSEPGDKTEPSLMHKVLRYYYDSENGIYQNNNFDFAEEEKDLLGAKITQNAYYNKTQTAPFDFIKINPVSSALKNARGNLTGVLRGEDFFEKRFASAKPIEEEALAVFTEAQSTPSALEKIPIEVLQKTIGLSKTETEKSSARNLNAKKTGGQISDTFKKLNSILITLSDEEKETQESSARLKFTRANFGTMAHSYLEHWIKNGDVQNVEESQDFDAKLRRIIEENFSAGTKRETLSEICRALVETFAQSELGKQAIDAKKSGRIIKSENAFKMKIGGGFVTGAIDLFFQNADNTYTIVDYKTDAAVSYEKYIAQQCCYRHALSKIYGIDFAKTKAFLFFLQFGEAMDMTEYSNIEEAKLEKLILQNSQQN